MTRSDSIAARELLSRTLAAQLSPGYFAALESLLAVRPLEVIAVLSALAGTKRKAGSGKFAPDPQAKHALHALGYRNPEQASLAEAVCVFLLVSACHVLEPALHELLVTRAYRTSSNDERMALLRSLVLLPEPQRFLAVAGDACRTHVQTVFEAIACDNPYPATYFDEASFNQLVLKALFVGAPLARVERLTARTTDELRRMTLAYASERRAAGRAVPADVSLVVPEAP